MASPPLRALAIASGTVIMIACSSTAGVSPRDGSLALGTWGDDSGGLIVGDTAAHLHIGCTFGDINGRIVLEAVGRFEGHGRYMLRAYPVAVGPAVPAHFSVQLDGNTLTAIATSNDTVQKRTVMRRPVRLLFGVEQKMANCPICRDPYRTNGSPARASQALSPRAAFREWKERRRAT